MASIYWKSLQELEEGREYLFVATTGLPLPWFRPVRMWRFAVATIGILSQLGRTGGCLAYSLRPGLRQGSTISIWEDSDSLRQFELQEPHSSAMRIFRSKKVRRFRYAQWKGSTLTLPRRWEEIAARFPRATQSA